MNVAKIIISWYEQSNDSDCTKCTNYTNKIIWKYYADNNGIMITYPYYIGNPMYEDDQCTDNKILYDPRIKPVSSYISFLYVCKGFLNFKPLYTHRIVDYLFLFSNIYMYMCFSKISLVYAQN